MIITVTAKFIQADLTAQVDVPNEPTKNFPTPGMAAMAYRYLFAQLVKTGEEMSLTPSGEISPGTQTETVEFIPTHMARKVDNGKVTYAIHGGKWSKFGVPVYPEVLKTLDLTTEELAKDILPLDGYSALAQIEGGKVKRVMALRF